MMLGVIGIPRRQELQLDSTQFGLAILAGQAEIDGVSIDAARSPLVQ